MQMLFTDKDYGEMKLPEKPLARNPLNGRFMKGNIPHNKGKKWQEWQSEEGRIRSSKGWENIIRHRPLKRPDAARNKKGIIAIGDNGKWLFFDHVRLAAQRFGCHAQNIRRCCKENQKRRKLKDGSVNTDHRYMAIRWYYEKDDIWMQKIDSR